MRVVAEKNIYLPEYYRDFSTGTLQELASMYREAIFALDSRDDLYGFVLREYLKEAVELVEEELERREEQ